MNTYRRPAPTPANRAEGTRTHIRDTLNVDTPPRPWSSPMTDPTPKPAMTMREIREQLGHPVPPPGVPDAEIIPVRFVVSSIPEGHIDRHSYTINVHYRGDGLYSVGNGLAYADAEGVWSYEPDRSFEDDERDGAALAWIAAHRFDLTAALRLARRLAPTLTVRGRSVADVLAEGAQR